MSGLHSVGNHCREPRPTSNHCFSTSNGRESGREAAVAAAQLESKEMEREVNGGHVGMWDTFAKAPPGHP